MDHDGKKFVRAFNRALYFRLVFRYDSCHMSNLPMASVKPFKSKNRDKIDPQAPNRNLKKVVIEIFERQSNL